MENTDFDKLFNPKTVAVVGATSKKNWGWSNGNAWIAGCMKQSFQGMIFPVHPKAESIMGFKAYKSIRDIPYDIDLAIFTVPISAVLEMMEQCAEKRVKFVHLLTAGFSETGFDKNKDIEQKLLETARKGNVRLVGPNCMGLYSPDGGLAWDVSFPTKSGSIGFISQSGQLAFQMIKRAEVTGIYFKKLVSFGNALDIQAQHFFEYFSGDDTISVLGAYLEGIKQGRKFFETVKTITPKKPVVIWKGGKTKGGSRATRSHTAAIAGSNEIWNAMCEQAGIIQVDSAIEMAYVFQTLHLNKPPRGTNVAIMGGAGGGSVTMTDIAEAEGLKVPSLQEKTIDGLREFVPIQGTSVNNPLDINPTLRVKGNMFRVMELLRDDENIDALIFNINLRGLANDFGIEHINDYMDNLVEAINVLEKPIYISLVGDEEPNIVAIREFIVGSFKRLKIVAFPDFNLAARVVDKLANYQAYLQRL